jgi:hypothetical protein
MKASTAASVSSRRSRVPRSETSTRANSNQSRSLLLPEYKQMRSDMIGASTAVSTRSDAAALQNDLAQRFNLSNAVRPTQKVIHFTLISCHIINLLYYFIIYNSEEKSTTRESFCFCFSPQPRREQPTPTLLLLLLPPQTDPPPLRQLPSHQSLHCIRMRGLRLLSGRFSTNTTDYGSIPRPRGHPHSCCGSPPSFRVGKHRKGCGEPAGCLLPHLHGRV